jgi:hypothetical protein
MTIHNHRACGFCTEFTPGEEATSICKQGRPGSAGTTVHATERPCVLFKRAPNLTPRETFVVKYQQLEPA